MLALFHASFRVLLSLEGGIMILSLLLDFRPLYETYPTLLLPNYKMRMNFLKTSELQLKKYGLTPQTPCYLPKPLSILPFSLSISGPNQLDLPSASLLVLT